MDFHVSDPTRDPVGAGRVPAFPGAAPLNRVSRLLADNEPSLPIFRVVYPCHYLLRGSVRYK